MNILVTGGAGFIGSNLVDKLILDNHSVSVIDDLSTGFASNLNPKNRINMYKLDVSDISCSYLFEGIDIVFHLAAFISVPESISFPVKCFNSNTVGTFNCLSACKKYKVPRFVFISSAAIYGNANPPFTEDLDFMPESPYACDKVCGEYYSNLFTQQKWTSCVNLRYQNVYGPRQLSSAVIPQFCLNVINDKISTIHGTGKQLRDYVYIEDVVDATIKAAFSDTNDTYNVGTGKPNSVIDLFSILKKISGKDIDSIFDNSCSRPQPNSYADISKIKRDLGWEPKISLEEGLDKTYKWYSCNKG